jgi:arylsulfatase A-like enzyme
MRSGTVRALTRMIGVPIACVLVAIGGCKPADQHAAMEPERPSLILLISIDTLRPDHLGVYGYERFTSPYLDALAREGVVFEDASSTAPWTLPAHASMLTGLFPLAHGALTSKTRLAEAVPTLATLLRAAGYETRTVFSSLWLEERTFGVTRDFDQSTFHPITMNRRSPSTMVTDRAIEWIDEGDDKPLFLFVHYYDVHGDYASLPQYERLFTSAYQGEADGTGWQLMRANLNDAHLTLCKEHFDPKVCQFAGGHGDRDWALDGSIGKFQFDEAGIRHNLSLYDAGVRQMDAELGRFLRLLGERDVLDDALIFVTSDHGEEFMEHGQVAHFLALYEETLRVPMLLRGPGVPANTRISTPVSLVDIAPTLLSIAGVPIPERMEGIDLAPLWRDPDGASAAAAKERFLYGEASGGLTNRMIVEDVFPILHSVRRGRYKLIHESIGDTVSLYDLKEDPGEREDIAAREPAITEELTRELRSRQMKSDMAAPVDAVELSEEDVERLKALGYVP